MAKNSILKGTQKVAQETEFNSFMKNLNDMIAMEETKDPDAPRHENVDDLMEDSEDEFDAEEVPGNPSYLDQMEEESEDEDFDNVDIEEYEDDDATDVINESFTGSAFEQLMALADAADEDLEDWD
jgi:hypothetical protein